MRGEDQPYPINTINGAYNHAIMAQERTSLYRVMDAEQYEAEKARQSKELGRYIGEGNAFPVFTHTR